MAISSASPMSRCVSRAARSSLCSARMAPAKPRRSTPLPAWCAPRAGASCDGTRKFPVKLPMPSSAKARLHLVSTPRRTPPPVGRHPVRRRAADAGARPGAQERAAIIDARRTELGLAPAVVEVLYDTLKELHRQGLTLLLAEQSIPLALGIADYGYVLQTGRVALEGPAAQLQRDEQVQEIYLGISTRAAAVGR